MYLFNSQCHREVIAATIDDGCAKYEPHPSGSSHSSTLTSRRPFPSTREAHKMEYELSPYDASQQATTSSPAAYDQAGK